MDGDALLRAYQEQVRRRPAPDGPDGSVERSAAVVRVLATSGGWTGVTWSDLDADTADAVVAAQVARFTQQGCPWEWKHHDGDQPDDLADRLARAGLAAGQPETVLAAMIDEVVDDVVDDVRCATPPAGVDVVEAVDEATVRALVQVHEQVFGGDHHAVGDALLRALADQPPRLRGVVAFATSGGRRVPVAAARLELVPGSTFAGLWGGGTAPGWRGRGIFRALVAHRARLAAAAGCQYLHVDATPASRSVLRGLGFRELGTTTPFTHPGTEG